MMEGKSAQSVALVDENSNNDEMNYRGPEHAEQEEVAAEDGGQVVATSTCNSGTDSNAASGGSGGDPQIETR